MFPKEVCLVVHPPRPPPPPAKFPCQIPLGVVLECMEPFDVDIFQLFPTLFSLLFCPVGGTLVASIPFSSCCGLSFHNNYIDECMTFGGESTHVERGAVACHQNVTNTAQS